MTQIQTMTNPELNRALAELMGCKVVKVSEGEFAYELQDSSGHCINTDGRGWESEQYAWAGASDYCTDPAASLEVQSAAIAKDADAYVQNLAIVKWGQPDEDVEDTAVWNKTMRYSIAELLTARPRERAEAAYITMQGVK
ncbi:MULTISPECIES: hypothetical protein [Paenibacillus]|uniref:Phage ABA sandwich domain-containing protein n=1 Tax=Paenibacillus borealis TaxID=160799 RepID=A0ABX3HNX8_PAEBO|nr:hypothetical protein [Paenibacillus borealis]OMD51883.1 hypothetical protein BSK56_04465 [Paenibacillus borealis]